MKKPENSSLILIIIAISIGMYFGFKPLFTNTPEGVVRELLVASLGAIFVLFTTVIVLNQQADRQIELEKSDKLFEKKLQVYSDVFDQTKQCIENEEFTEKDLIELRFIAHKLITFVGFESAQSMVNIIKFATNLLKNSSESNTDNYKLSQDDQIKFNEAIVANEDKELMIRFGKKFKVSHLDVPLYRYRKHDTNMTNDEDRMRKFDHALQLKHKFK